MLYMLQTKYYINIEIISMLIFYIYIYNNLKLIKFILIINYYQNNINSIIYIKNITVNYIITLIKVHPIILYIKLLFIIIYLLKFNIQCLNILLIRLVSLSFFTLITGSYWGLNNSQWGYFWLNDNIEWFLLIYFIYLINLLHNYKHNLNIKKINKIIKINFFFLILIRYNIINTLHNFFMNDDNKNLFKLKSKNVINYLFTYIYIIIIKFIIVVLNNNKLNKYNNKYYLSILYLIFIYLYINIIFKIITTIFIIFFITTNTFVKIKKKIIHICIICLCLFWLLKIYTSDNIKLIFKIKQSHYFKLCIENIYISNYNIIKMLSTKNYLLNINKINNKFHINLYINTIITNINNIITLQYISFYFKLYSIIFIISMKICNK